MTLSIRRSAVALLAGIALVAAALLAVPQHAGAATIYACKSRSGNLRLVGKKTRCKRGQKKIKWSTTGPAGKNGSNGARGSNGANGQPQRMIKFRASQANVIRPTPIALFSADGIRYTFTCQFALIADVGNLFASGPSGQAYGMGVFARPTGITSLSNDLRSNVTVSAISGTPVAIAATPSAATSDRSIEQYGVWTVTVEGPTSTTWIHAWFDTNPTCAIRGTAITVPN